MYPSFCLFQDILTKEIIGRGTKKGETSSAEAETASPIAPERFDPLIRAPLS